MPASRQRLKSLGAQAIAAVARGGGLSGVGSKDGRGPALFRLRAKERQHLARIFRIEVAGRLISEHEPRLTNQRPRDRHALQLAARELPRRAPTAAIIARTFAGSLAPRRRSGSATFCSTVSCGSTWKAWKTKP